MLGLTYHFKDQYGDRRFRYTEAVSYTHLTLKRFFARFEQNGLTINRFSADCGSCSEAIVEEIEKHCKSFYIPVSYTHLDVYKRQLYPC